MPAQLPQGYMDRPPGVVAFGGPTGLRCRATLPHSYRTRRVSGWKSVRVKNEELES
jgi:hypothetical protein